MSFIPPAPFPVAFGAAFAARGGFVGADLLGDAPVAGGGGTAFGGVRATVAEGSGGGAGVRATVKVGSGRPVAADFTGSAFDPLNAMIPRKSMAPATPAPIISFFFLVSFGRNSTSSLSDSPTSIVNAGGGELRGVGTGGVLLARFWMA